MKLYQILLIITTAIASLLSLFGIFYFPDLTLFLAFLTSFSTLSYFRPKWGLAFILFLPVFGEYSRFLLFGKSLVASDILIPIFTIFWLIKKPSLSLLKLASTLLKIIILFLSIAFLSLLISLTALPLNDVISGSLYFIRLLSYIALFPITTTLFHSLPSQSKLLKYLLIVSLLIALGGYIQLYFMPNLEELAKTQGYDPHLNRLVGSWLDPNFIGGFFAFIISIYISITLYSKSTKHRILLITAITILGTALFLTYSRSAYLAIAASILTIGLLKSRKLVIAILIIGTIGVSVSDRAQQRLSELSTSITSVLFNNSENPDPTARLRIQNWEQTFQLISQKPLFGHGYNNLSSVKLQEGFVENEGVHSASGSDSSLLTITATTGFLGLISFLLIITLMAIKSAQKWFQSKHPLSKGLGLGFFSGLIGLLVHSLFVNSLLFPQIMIFFWPMLGLIYSNHQSKN